MPLLKRRASRDVEIPSSSMADIAFLLLIFFLLVTTINTEKGIYMQLPPKLTDEEPPEIRDRNLLVVLVNNDGNVLVEGEFMRIENIREEVIKHVTNNGQDPGYSENPEKAVVSFKTERELSYDRYVEVLDEIKGAYVEIWDDYARSEVGAPDYPTYKASLPEDDPNTPEDEGLDRVKDRYPLKLSLAEPDPG